MQEDRLTDDDIYDVLLWIEYTTEQRQVSEHSLNVNLCSMY